MLSRPVALCIITVGPSGGVSGVAFLQGCEAHCTVSLRGGGRQGAAMLPIEGVETVAFQASVFLFFFSKAVCTARILVSWVAVSTST